MPGERELWNAIDEYIVGHLLDDDPVLDAALADSDAAGLPPIAVAPNMGKLLHLLLRLAQARNVLELGTLGGYSTIWLARALPEDGRLISLEANPEYASVAQANVARAGLADRVQVRVGPALETLPRLAAEGAGPFDAIFIDADKQNNPAYVRWALELSRPGTLLVVDNVVRAGAVLDPDADDPSGGNALVRGVRALYELLADEPRLTATAIQTVGSKGHDGFVLALVER